MAPDQRLKTRSKTASDEKSTAKTEVKASKSKPIGFAPMITLFIFSTAMLVLPLVTYFSIRHYIVNSTTIAAMGAIVMVQLIVAFYIYKAWNDENREHEKDRLKQR